MAFELNKPLIAVFSNWTDEGNIVNGYEYVLTYLGYIDIGWGPMYVWMYNHLYDGTSSLGMYYAVSPSGGVNGGGPTAKTGLITYYEWSGLFVQTDVELWTSEFHEDPNEDGYYGGDAVVSQVGNPGPSYFIPNPLVPDRPPDYDPDLGWDEANSVWTPTARGGGRYKQQLVAVGKDGEIYYGDVG